MGQNLRELAVSASWESPWTVPLDQSECLVISPRFRSFFFSTATSSRRVSPKSQPRNPIQTNLRADYRMLGHASLNATESPKSSPLLRKLCLLHREKSAGFVRAHRSSRSIHCCSNA